MKKENLALCLQLFAEAADGGTAQFTGVNEAAAAPQATGETQASDAGVQEDRSSAFEKLIKGEFKQEYDARVRDTLQKRLKDHKDLTQKLEALTPAVTAMARRYGVDPEDIPALTRAVETDRATAIRQPQLQAQHQTQVWKDQAVTDTKLDELAREVREHNGFAHRIPVLEEKIKVLSHRLETLERK